MKPLKDLLAQIQRYGFFIWKNCVCVKGKPDKVGTMQEVVVTVHIDIACALQPRSNKGDSRMTFALSYGSQALFTAVYFYVCNVRCPCMSSWAPSARRCLPRLEEETRSPEAGVAHISYVGAGASKGTVSTLQYWTISPDPKHFFMLDIKIYP